MNSDASAELIGRKSTAYTLAILAVVGLAIFFIGAGPEFASNSGDVSVSTSEMSFPIALVGFCLYSGSTLILHAGG